MAAMRAPSEDPPMMPVHLSEPPPIPAFVEVFEQMQVGELTRCALMSVPMCLCEVVI